MVPRPAASVSSVNLLEIQILGHYPRPTESKTLRVGLAINFNELPHKMLIAQRIIPGRMSSRVTAMVLSLWISQFPLCIVFLWVSKQCSYKTAKDWQRFLKYQELGVWAKLAIWPIILGLPHPGTLTSIQTRHLAIRISLSLLLQLPNLLLASSSLGDQPELPSPTGWCSGLFSTLLASFIFPITPSISSHHGNKP